MSTVVAGGEGKAARFTSAFGALLPLTLGQRGTFTQRDWDSGGDGG